MGWQRPTPATVWQAISVWLEIAYPAEPPSAVRSRLENLRAVADGDFFESGVFEHDDKPEPVRYRLRLGNRFYPHMKLVIERSPSNSYLFRADTHDQHICPNPQSPEQKALRELMSRNHEFAGTIEAAWEEAGLPTFKSYLRQDLAKRKQ